MGVRGVLFDAGGVLIRPRGGRWNPRFDFESVLARHHPGVAPARLPAAFAAGQRALDAAPGTLDRASYHRAILAALEIPAAEPLLAELEAPSPVPPVEAYADAEPALRRLRGRGLRLGVVSDSWPELTDLLAALGLAAYLDVVVISAVLGCTKPDPRMYAAGSDGLGLPPADCLFIDDDPALVAAAIALGYEGTVMAREAGPGLRTLAGLLP